MLVFGPYSSRINRFRTNKDNTEFLFILLLAILIYSIKNKLYINVFIIPNYKACSRVVAVSLFPLLVALMP